MANSSEGTAYKIRFVTLNENIVLPVNPTEVSVQYGGDNASYNVVGIGDIIIPRTPKLAAVSFESFFPKTGDFLTYANESAWYEPRDYVSFFRNLQTEQQIFKLVICRADGFDPTFDTNITAVINDFTITDKGGESGDVYYSMTISEWRNAQPEKLEIASSGETDSNGATTKPRELVAIKQRNTELYPLKVGQVVSVTGRVFALPEMTDIQWRLSRKIASQQTGTISRIIDLKTPAKKMIHIIGIGWIEEKNCTPVDGNKNAGFMIKGR